MIDGGHDHAMHFKTFCCMISMFYHFFKILNLGPVWWVCLFYISFFFDWRQKLVRYGVIWCICFYFTTFLLNLFQQCVILYNLSLCGHQKRTSNKVQFGSAALFRSINLKKLDTILLLLHRWSEKKRNYWCKVLIMELLYFFNLLNFGFFRFFFE